MTQRHGRLVGALYLAGTAFGVLGVALGGPALAALATGDAAAARAALGAASAPALTGAALMTLGMGLALMAMAVVLAPHVRRSSEALANGILVFRGAVEGAFYLLSALLIAVAAALVGAESGALGLVVAAIDRLAPLGSVLFVVGAVAVYLGLRAGRLVPGWLLWWGLLAAVPYLAHALLQLFQLPTSPVLEAPLALQEIVMGVWLVVRGFEAPRSVDAEVHPRRDACAVSD